MQGDTHAILRLTMSKRFRACETCHTLKIKCAPSPTDPTICGRCAKSGAECFPAARRWQRDRIVELEEQIKELQEKLEEIGTSTRDKSTQGTSTRDSSAPSIEDPGPSTTPQTALTTPGANELSLLDAQVSPEIQSKCLDASAITINPFWSVIPIPQGQSTNAWFALLRAERPVSLLAIIAYLVSPEQVKITAHAQDDLRKKVLEKLGLVAVGLHPPSHDLALAALIVSLWNRPSINDTHGNSFHLVELARSMCVDMGFGGPEFQSSPAAWFFRVPGPLTLPMRQTWLISCVASTFASLSTRSKPVMEWGQSHYEAVRVWEKDDSADAHFLEILYIAALHSKVANDLDLCDVRIVHEIDSETVKVVQNQTQMRLEELSRRPLAHDLQLQFWRALTLIYINEPVLHTQTNKVLFSSPYIAAKIGATNFASPARVTESARTAILSMAEACHLVINLVRQMDPKLVLSMPSLCFASGLTYSLSILIKIFIATSAPGNTYGKILGGARLDLRPALESMKAIKESLLTVDPFMGTWTTRLVGSVEWLGAWLADYEAILIRYEHNLERGTADRAIEGLSPNGAF